MTRTEETSLGGQAALSTRCIHCGNPIDAGGNYADGPDGPAHVHCHYERQPAPRTDPATGYQETSWMAALSRLGWALTGDWHERSAIDAEQPNPAMWDQPDHLPWVVVHETPCPWDSGQVEPATDARAPWANHTCRHKHVHPGPRPGGPEPP